MQPKFADVAFTRAKVQEAVTKFSGSPQKDKFIKKYGVTLQMPANYISQAKFFRNDVNYIIMANKQTFPENVIFYDFDKVSMGTQAQDEDYRRENISQSSSLTFKVLQSSEGTFKWANSRQTDPNDYQKNGVAMFNDNCKYLGLVRSYEEETEADIFNLKKKVQTNYAVDIFDCSSIDFFLRSEPINREDPSFQFSIQDPSFADFFQGDQVQMSFSHSNQYLSMVRAGKDLKIFCLEGAEKEQPIVKADFEVALPLEFHGIMAVYVNEEELKYSKVAYKRKGAKYIDIVNLAWLDEFKKLEIASGSHVSKNQFNDLNYKHKTHSLSISCMKVYQHESAFSIDGSQFIHSSDQSTLVLNLSEDKEVSSQKLLQNLEGRTARYIMPRKDKSDFIVAYADALSQQIGVRLAFDSQKKTKLEFKFIEGSVVIRDMFEEESDGQLLVVLSRDDEEFIFFRVRDFAKHKEFQRFYSCSLYTFEWPYVCYLKGASEIIIQNAFAPSIAFYLRFKELDADSYISHIFLTQHLNLYFSIANSSSHSLYCQDLDCLQPLLMRVGSTNEYAERLFHLGARYVKQLFGSQLTLPILTLQKQEAKFRYVSKFIIRDSSSNKKVQLNQERMIFFRTHHKIYKWDAARKEPVYVDECNRFLEIDQNLGMYLITNKLTKKSEIKFIKFQYSDYSIGPIYEEIEGKIEDFLVSEKQILVLIKGPMVNPGARLMKIFEYDQALKPRLQHQIEVNDSNFIGDFITTQIFANSMIAQQNRAYFVITNMRKPKIHSFEEVLPLEEGDQVQFASPMVNLTYRKMMFFKVNQQKCSAKTCVILPFLNENHLTFNIKQTKVQYNNFIEFPISPTQTKQCILTVHPFFSSVFLYTMRGQLLEKVNIEQVSKDVGDQQLCVSPSCRVFAYLNNKGFEFEVVSLIKITAEIESEIAAAAGAEGQEGEQRNMVYAQYPFRHENTVRGKLPYEVPQVRIFVLENVEMVQILVQEEYFNSIKKRTAFDVVQYYQTNQCSVKATMNDNMDLAFYFQKNNEYGNVIRDILLVKAGQQRTATLVRMPLEEPSEPIELSEPNESLHSLLLKNRQEDPNFDSMKHVGWCVGVLLLSDFIVVWSEREVYFQEVARANSNTGIIELQKISFEVPKERTSGEQAKISSVHSQGQNEDDRAQNDLFIVIKVQIEGYAHFLKYNLLKQKEYSFYESSLLSQAMFDNDRKPFIIDAFFVHNLNTMIPLYYYQASMGDLKGSEKVPEYFDKGSRFSHSRTNPEFMVRNRLYLTHSYQTLMLQAEKKQDLLTEDNYDPTIVYALDGNTALHTFASNFQQLNYILDQYQQSNPQLINMLLMKNNEGKTVLKLAIEQQNAKCVNLILRKIASLSMNNIHSVKEDVSHLLDYDGFEKYLSLCFFQTNQMKAKTAMKMHEQALQTGGFIIHPQLTSYLDRQFYKAFKPQGDEEEQVQKSVIVSAIDAGWIFRERCGEEFLLALSSCDNMNFFEIDTVRIIILYLWEKVKPKIILHMFVPFLINFTLFNVYALYSFEQSHCQSLLDDDVVIAETITYTNLILLLFGTVYALYIEFMQMRFHKHEYFKSMWNMLDLSAALFTVIIMVLEFFRIGDATDIRPIIAIAILLYYLRFFYYLRIFDNMASFVRIIVEITADIKIFIVVLFIGIAGFGVAFFILSRNITGLEVTVDEKSVVLEGFISNVYESLLYSYLLTVGEFDTDLFQDSPNAVLLWVLFIIATLFSLIILLNMLVAIMGDSYNRVNEQSENQTYREHLQLIVENWFLIKNKRSTFKDVKYLIAIEQDKVLMKKNDFSKKLNKVQATLADKIQANSELLEKVLKNQEAHFNAIRNMQREEDSSMILLTNE